jgi:hypothetical protein
VHTGPDLHHRGCIRVVIEIAGWFESEHVLCQGNDNMPFYVSQGPPVQALNVNRYTHHIYKAWPLSLAEDGQQQSLLRATKLQAHFN